MASRISAPKSRIYEIYSPRCPCPKCGEVLSAPTHSEFLQQKNVRHTWMCDKCDYEFETLIWLNLPPATS
jgi:transcription elongation factor Elf1